MKKKWILILLVCLLAAAPLAGCKADTLEAQSNFSPLVASKATPEGIREASEYLNICFDGRIDEDSASHMLAAYVEYLYRYTTTEYDKTLISSLSAYYNPEKNCIDEELIQRSEALSLYEDLKAGQVLIISREGEMGLQIYYQGLLDAYGHKISEGLYALYELNETVRRQPAVENSTLMISWKEILDRAYTAECLLKEYSEDHLVLDDADWLYRQYLTILLTGTVNTPVFDYTTHVFSTDATNAYQEFVRNYPDTTLAWMLTEYFTYLGGMGFTLDYDDTEASAAFFETCDALAAQADAKAKADTKAEQAD